ncbi:hypothetical protein F5X96DRAFT_675662 [Biscogniauxia mediterranea]|nr:hypothetical protein F5X96DRAFT_675662 [Biscogniauxia mediterranea]
MGDGVEFPKFPEVLAPKADGSGPIVVADMSSNILSRRSPVKNFTVVFFRAPKKKNRFYWRDGGVYQKEPATLIIHLAFSKFVAEDWASDTPAPNSDEVDGQEAVANAKAALIYNALEALPNIYKINGNADEAMSEFLEKKALHSASPG